jgi:uncharacterized membrane protein YidH (DUF202 family)
MARMGLSSWIFIAFCIFAVVWYGPIIYNDVTHPELWSDLRHDPRWYGTGLILVAVAGVALVVSAWRWQRRWNRMSREQRRKEAERILKGR